LTGADLFELPLFKQAPAELENLIAALLHLIRVKHARFARL